MNTKEKAGPVLTVAHVLFGVLAASLAAVLVIGTLLALTATTAEAAALRLAGEAVTPKRAFYAGPRNVVYNWELAGQGKQTVRVEVVRRKTGRVARRWRRENVVAGQRQRISWNGAAKDGDHVASGEYFFRVRGGGGGRVAERRRRDSRTVNLSHHKFPVRGRHSYGDGIGAGRGHQGQDVFARCGTELVAARAGRVQFKGRHSAAGNYVVIDGRGTRSDYVYMHLRRNVMVRKGERVRTGERIGRVGATGNARGCHLHFELWSGPGWYQGGHPMRSVTKSLRRWDRWS